jgi:hypothetical protein
VYNYGYRVVVADLQAAAAEADPAAVAFSAFR